MLAGSPHLGKLRYLNLSGNDIDPEGALALVESTRLKSLTELHICSNGIEMKWCDMPRQRFGHRALRVGL